MNNSDFNFISMVLHFYEEKGDPTRWTCWDEVRCSRLMPEFYFTWKTMEDYRKLVKLACEKYKDIVDEYSDGA